MDMPAHSEQFDMVALLGHVIPGSFFCLFASWWTLQLARRRHDFVPQATYPVQFRSCSIPVEGIAKIIAASIGIIGELATISYISGWQHITMYTSYGFSGVIDLFTLRHGCLPDHSDYAGMSLAILLECVILSSHSSPDMPLESHGHSLLFLTHSWFRHPKSLVSTVVITFIASLVEMWTLDNPKYAVSLSKAVALNCHGAWFIGMGIGYHNIGDTTVGSMMVHKMRVTLWFCWIVLTVVAVTAVLNSRLFTRTSSNNSKGRKSTSAMGEYLLLQAEAEDEAWSRGGLITTEDPIVKPRHGTQTAEHIT